MFTPVRSALVILALSLSAPGFADQPANNQNLPLEVAERLAIANEPGVLSLAAKAEALASEATAVRQLPDPELQLSAANFPTDTFNLDQEPMTQLKVGISQKIPASGALKARSQIRQKQSQAMQWQAQDRQLQVLRQVRRDWLELYYWQQAGEIVTESKVVFEQLLAVVNSLYEVGKKQQHDLLRAELELSRLDDRLIDITDRCSRQKANLSRWIGDMSQYDAAQALPHWSLSVGNHHDRLLTHPAIQSLDKQVAARHHGIELAESGYRPNWGVSLSYGYRQEDFNGRELPDFFSAGVTVQLPLFTGKRQDQSYRASVQQHQSSRSERQEKLVAMRAELDNLTVDARHLEQRFQLYQQTILVQANQQVDAVLKAYRSDAADFDEVMRAVLSELSLRLEYQRLRIDYLQGAAHVKYLTEYDELERLKP
ncbi:TolC family protein [Porticoccus sp. GXU_MW_L64]